MSGSRGSTGSGPEAGADAADSPTTLRERLAGVRGLILDADGVIVLRGAPLPGSPEALARLAALRVPFRILTNYSSAHRETLAARFSGGAVPADRFITAASATAAHTAAAFAGRPLFVIGAPDAMREFAGQRLLTPDEADRLGPGELAAVVIGDGGDDLSFRNLDIAFRAVRKGAALVAMHKNPWWYTSRGETLDSGSVVAGLEFATGRRALVVGKPNPLVFRQAVAGIAADLGLRRLPAGRVAMIGDDPRSDVAAAKRVGLRGILVLTGKASAEEIPALRSGPVGTRPDAIAPSLSEVVAALD